MGDTHTQSSDREHLVIPPGTTVLYVGSESKAGAITTRLEQATDHLCTQTATAAEDARAVVENDDVDCLVAEYDLADSDGIDLLESVRKQHPNLPFVLYTDDESIETATRAISADVSEYVLRSDESAEQRLTDTVVETVHKTTRLQRRDLLEQLINLVPVGVVVHDIDGELIQANDRGRELLGIASDEPLTEALEDHHVYHPDGTPYDRPQLPPVKAFRTGAPVRDELLYIEPPDDGPIWVSMNSTPIYDDTGENIVRVISTGQDVTELKNREHQLEATNAELKKTRNRFQALTENASVAVLTMDESSTIQFANDTVEDVFGYAPDRLEGESMDVLIPDRLVDDHYAAVERYLETGTRKLDWSWVELPAVHESGHTIDIGLSYGTTQVNGSQLFTAVIRDITEEKARQRELEDKRKQLEATVAELERSNRELEQFAQAVSHDLKEPIRTVSNYLGLLERRYAGEFDDDADDFLEFAAEGSERAQRMIEDLLAYARVDHGGEIDEVVDLNDVVETVVRDCKRSHESSEVDVSVGNLPPVVGNRTRLEQVFQNLLSNAIEHADSEPVVVDVTAEQCDGSCVVSVSDNGPGIRPEEQDQIFGLFETSRDSEGTGVGLALCEKIVHNHGGEIWVDSGDDGTTFSFIMQPSTA
ncbi:hypothetical protein BV210_16005 [Halorientalis sp. IM1011]|uniref:ATP-binding protein n=1 Tax=Halorientalis sp. IM1011 TaxID=1932360 RepID=UPI00097CCAEB|nr:ATP-binding protein [Halorientalis sp. IM1011]AQL44117.1 hypothetical protein BV210_16005 [Halorientalis sp. IM1011]